MSVHIENGDVVYDVSWPDWADFKVEDVNQDYALSVPSCFQAYLRGFHRSEQTAELNFPIDLAELRATKSSWVALRGPSDVFVVACALTFAEAFFNKYGNYELTTDALPDFYAKSEALDKEIGTQHCAPWALCIANWLGGWGGAVEGFTVTVPGLIAYVGEKTFAALDVNLTKYLQPEQLNWQGDDGSVVNLEDALRSLKQVSPWIHAWVVCHAFAKATKKYVEQQTQVEQKQVQAVQKIAETADAAGKSMDALLEALNKALAAVTSILNWIVPIALIGGGIWLATLFGPKIAKAVRESQEKRKKIH